MRPIIWTFAVGLSLAAWRGALSAPSAADFIHELKVGESIWSVSQVYLAQPKNWRKLQQHNGIRQEKQLPPGTRVRIPMTWLKQENIDVTVISVTGRARWTSQGASTSQEVNPGVKLRSGDRLATEAQSHVGLRLPDGSEIMVMPLSELGLVAFKYVGTPVTDVTFKLSRGRVETQVTPLGHPASRYEITTPTAQLGVRGTEFRVSLSDNASRSTSEVEGGVVTAANPTLPNSARIELSEGFATIVRAGKVPLAPIAMLPAPDLRSISGLVLGNDVEHAFGAIGGAVAYRIHLAREVPSRDVVLDRVTTEPRIHLSKLSAGGYLLRVRAVDSQGIEGRDARISFRVEDIQL